MKVEAKIFNYITGFFFLAAIVYGFWSTEPVGTVALILVGGTADVAPMTVTIANLVNSLGQGYHLLTAAAFISMILPLIVFIGLQRYFVRGILGGSVKG